MKALIAVKRVIDPYVKIRVKQDGSEVETQNVKMSMNPFDEIAIEEALRLREKGFISEIVLCTVGPVTHQDILRHGLALGADRAILVQCEKTFCSLNIAKILQEIVRREVPQLVLMGKQSIDGDNNQTPQMLAALLQWSQATYASKIEPHDTQIMVTREIDGGLETLALNLPAIISTDLRLNVPRYATLPNIMKSKSKPLQVIDLAELNLNLKDHIKIVKVTAPAVRKGGIMLNSVEELVEKLRNEAKVI
jgi:electron transfer flavoprotein beta subunit